MPIPKARGLIDRDDGPVGDHRDAIRKRVSFVHVVGREQHGHAIACEITDQGPGRPAGIGVETGRRFVEEEEIWVSYDTEP